MSTRFHPVDSPLQTRSQQIRNLLPCVLLALRHLPLLFAQSLSSELVHKRPGTPRMLFSERHSRGGTTQMARKGQGTEIVAGRIEGLCSPVGPSDPSSST